MKIVRQAFVIALVALVISGCATRSSSVPYDPANFGVPDPPAAAAPAAPQTLRPMDKIQITVFQEPELSGQFQVDPTGKVNLPLLGQLEVHGRTPAEVSELIRGRLAERYLRNPNVQVAVTEAARDAVTVEGAVTRSGVFPLPGPTTLIRAIALAGGTTRAANDSAVIVFRTIRGQRMAAAFDLRAIRRANAPDPVIYPEDVVVVTDSQSRAMFQDIISVVPILGIFRPF